MGHRRNTASALMIAVAAYLEKNKSLRRRKKNPVLLKELAEAFKADHPELVKNYRDNTILSTFKQINSGNRSIRVKLSPDKANTKPVTRDDITEIIKFNRELEDKERQEEEMPTADRVKLDRKMAAITAEYHGLKRRYKSLMNEFERLEMRNEALVLAKEIPDVWTIDRVLSDKKDEGVPVLMWSDWHVEEQVNSETINGLNEYNLDIAKDRAMTMVRNSLKLIAQYRYSNDIKQVVVWLGGDFITGYIHEDLKLTNFLPPTKAMMYAKSLIISCLNYLIEEGGFKKITVVCNYGNHGRINVHKLIAASHEDSYEWMMYKMLEEYYEKNKKVEFIVENGKISYVDIMGTMCRFTHGDQYRFSGGIGGLTVPLYKQLMRWDMQKKADHTFLAHYHTRFDPTINSSMNGSLIGFNAFAQEVGAPLGPPLQGMKLIHSKYGNLVQSSNVYCE